MSASRRYKAPQAHGEVLADPSPEAAARLVGPNREIRRKLLPEDLFTSARQNVLDAAVSYLRDCGEPVPPLNDGPLIVTGHQPELFHPGVWAKNFAAHGLARRVGGLSLNLIADSDTLKDRTIRVPVVAGDVTRLDIRAYDDASPEMPYEVARVRNVKKFDRFGRDESINFGVHGHSMVPDVGNAYYGNPFDQYDADPETSIGEHFSRVRRTQERAWGCHNLELPVSRLCRTDAWAEFVAAIERRLPEFMRVYNAAIEDYRRANRVRSVNHPAPLLEPGERPFWRMTATGRDRPFAAHPPGELRPRALTLTLFARLFFADLWIHGIGGGKYDEVTDAIIRGFFRCEPPAYQVLTLTARLPFAVEGDPVTSADSIKQLVRYRQWNPQRYQAGHVELPVMMLLRRVAELIAWQPATRRERRERYHQIRETKAILATTALVSSHEEWIAAALARQQTAAILRRRDYAWVLFPEATLRPLMTHFL